jgi:hypothetical protein
MQPYPSSDKTIEPDRASTPPPSVQNAVKLMYVGAAVSTVSLVISLINIGGTKSAIRKARPTLTAAQVNQLNHFIILVAVISGVLGVALWLWMARVSSQGRNWGRIVSSVLFALATVDLWGVLSQPKTVLGLIFPILTWLVGLGAIIFLWRRESSEFFKPVQRDVIR